MSGGNFGHAELRNLLEQVKWGAPDDKELDAVALALGAGKISGDNVYTAVHLLGRAARPRDEALIATFLNGHQGPMVARIAIQTLCSSFGAARNYRCQLLRFIGREPWDEGDDVRLVALSQAGEHLRSILDPELFSAILAIAADEAELATTRLGALSALGRALGDSWGALPSPTLTVLDRAWTAEMLDRAQRASRET